jgi:hypothetical protein
MLSSYLLFQLAPFIYLYKLQSIVFNLISLHLAPPQIRAQLLLAQLQCRPTTPLLQLREQKKGPK